MPVAYQPSLPQSRWSGNIAARYRAIYGLSEASGVGLPEARKHWGLERALTEELLKSTPENRWQTFSNCYSQLYAELPWLNETPDSNSSPPAYAQWERLLPKPSRVFEIGSGKARLLKYLSARGHECVATEITPERGSKHALAGDALAWRVTDGIHLADFEVAESYDVVISTDVIEHFHPDDLQTHFDHARRILKKGGRYILTTPHVGSGPHDLSAAFGLERAECMHLKEYDFSTLDRMMKLSGFSVKAVFPPSKIFSKIGYCRESRAFLIYLKIFDIDRIMPPSIRRNMRRFEKLLLVPGDIWLSATAV